MRVNVHAGHNPEGKIASGAKGLISESTENRKVKDFVVQELGRLGHQVYDCTVEDGKSQNDVLRKIVKKCNSHPVDIDVSIHFNSGRQDAVGDGKLGGTEVYVYDINAGALSYAQRVMREIQMLGFPVRDDGVKDFVKENPWLYVLRKTKAPAMLIECCFVDDKDDVDLYDASSMAKAIVRGITGEEVQGGIEEQGDEFYSKYTGDEISIVMALQAVGAESSFSAREKMAEKNGIRDYKGTAEQNLTLLELLKNGALKK